MIITPTTDAAAAHLTAAAVPEIANRGMSEPLSPPSPSNGSTDLAAALAELNGLMLCTPSVEDLLDDAARLAARAVGPPVECGITLRRDQQVHTVATSGRLAAEVDEEQYAQGDGPCLETVRTGEPVVVTDYATDTRWGDYRSHALSYGVRSSLSLPLSADGETRGALNLYAMIPNAFGDGERDRAGLFAAQVSTALTMVLRQARQLQLSEHLRSALASRSVIDQALGILMDQQRCDADAAFDLLRAASQHRNRKLRDVAVDIVAAVSGQPPRPGSFREPN